MRGRIILAIVAAAGATLVAGGQPTGALAAANAALGADTITSIEYAGKGKWHLFGQAVNPSAQDPEYDMSNYTVTIDYVHAAKHMVMNRMQTVEPGRVRPAPHDERADEYVSGAVSWVVMPPGGPATGLPLANIPEQKNVEERAMEIWATPHGFLRLATANHATSKAVKGGTEVSFSDGTHKFVGTINAQHEVVRILTWIDSPVLGDMPCEALFTDYRDFGGVRFPSHIVRLMAGKTRLDITVSSVTANPHVDIQTPEPMRVAMTAPVKTTAEKLADGVYWIRGFQWHSVAVDQGDHIVVIDGPLHEARSLAVIAQVKEAIPNKPIKYLVNTHAHFDHAGGLRTYAAEGATIVTLPINQAYYEKSWKAPRTLMPDRLSTSGKKAVFLPVTNDKLVLPDAKHPVEVYHQIGTDHNDAVAMIYLPADKILIQVDAWNTESLNAPMPRSVNPYMVNLNDNIQRLKLDVALIVPLHGPRTGTVAELQERIKAPAAAAK